MKINGIGGVFIYSNNPERLAEWYSRHLGIDLTNDEQMNTYYQAIFYRDLDEPSRKLHRVFAIMPTKTPLGPDRTETMINYRVDNIEALVHQLNAEGIVTEPIGVQRDTEG